jgi:hypothetical protein
MRAIEDAMRLCRYAGVKIKSANKIDYGWENLVAVGFEGQLATGISPQLIKYIFIS